MKVFQINDTELWAAASQEDALTLYREENTPFIDEEICITELDDHDLDRRYPAFDEDERPIPGQMTSVREMLAEMSGPGFVASSES